MNYEVDRRVGQNIRKIRESKNMTQEILSAKLQVYDCDVSRSALAKMEVGQRHIYVDEIIALKQIFNVSYNDFFA